MTSKSDDPNPRLQPHVIADKVAIAVGCARLKRDMANASKAAVGRPADLAAQARAALADRRVMRALHTIAGSPSPVKKEG